MEVGKAIRGWRKLRGLSQHSVGQRSGIASNTIGLYERGISSPTIHQLERIAAVLDVGLLQLLAGPEPPETSRSEAAEPRPSSGPPRAVARLCMVPCIEAWNGRPIDAGSARRWPVLCDLLPHDGCLVTRVPDDSMQPYLVEGDAILVDPTVETVSSGALVLARIEDAVLPRRYLELGGRPILEAYHQVYPPTPVRGNQVVGLVIAVLERHLIGPT